jgi:hypothetical protein
LQVVRRTLPKQGAKKAQSLKKVGRSYLAAAEVLALRTTTRRRVADSLVWRHTLPRIPLTAKHNVLRCAPHQARIVIATSNC